MTTKEAPPTDSVEVRRWLVDAERSKLFFDAVIAIAMTLLILPLMEGVVASDETSGTAWLGDHAWELLSFVISFTVIAMFWIEHHHLFADVTHVSTGLLWWSVAWLLAIVWLPVATSMSGAMGRTDAWVKAIYIGSMLAASALTLAHRVFLRAHLALHHIGEERMRRGMALSLATVTLFAASLVLVALLPVVGYFALLLMLLVVPLQRLYTRALGANAQ